MSKELDVKAIECLKDDAAKLATEIQQLLIQKQPLAPAVAMACAIIIRNIYIMDFDRKAEVSEMDYFLHLARIAAEEFDSVQERVH